MNLAGVLSPKVCFSGLLFLGLLPVSTGAQTGRTPDSNEQRSFTMEFPFDHPVPLNRAANKALASDQSIADVLKDDHLSIETMPPDWFTASEVHLGAQDKADLVVMGAKISLGPYSAGFWVLRQGPEGYEIVLATHAHDLALLDTRTNGLRDIETGLPTLGKSYSEKYRFDGHRYQLESPAGDDQASKIPAEEAQFTPEQLKQYYLVYGNPDVTYLRALFDAYLHKSGGTDLERQLLGKWSKDYYRSKFVVLFRDGNVFGGTLITIMFRGRQDKVFVAWVYPEGNEGKLTLKGFDLAKFNDEDIRRMQIRYRKLIEDKIHSM